MWAKRNSKAYHTGRSTIVVRAKCEINEYKKNRYRIEVSEIPFQQVRDNVVEKIAGLVKSDRVNGISGIKDLSDLKEPVKLHIDLKGDADPEIVLNQLYQFSPFAVVILDDLPRLGGWKASRVVDQGHP